MVKNYYAGSTRVAMRRGTSSVYWLLGDHLGSQAITADGSGVKISEVRYYPWGEDRYYAYTSSTTYRYTGQRLESSIGLYYYGARWYDPYLNRWIQPDNIIPDPSNPNDLDRYAYVRNNPTKYIDPSGHSIGLPPVNINPCRLNPEFCQELLNDDFTQPNQESNSDNTSSKNQELEEVLSDNVRAWEDQTFMEDGDYSWWIKYKSLTFGTAIPNPYTGILIGWHITITKDQYGELYVGCGLDVDKSPLLVNVSYLQGQINQQDLPRNKQDEPGFLQNFLSGNSIQVYIAPFVDIQLNFPFSGGTAFDLGLGTPQGGISWTYTFYIP